MVTNGRVKVGSSPVPVCAVSAGGCVLYASGGGVYVGGPGVGADGDNAGLPLPARELVTLPGALPRPSVTVPSDTDDVSVVYAIGDRADLELTYFVP